MNARSKSRIIALAVAAACAFGAWKLAGSLFCSDDGDDNAQIERAKHLVNQVWIDHLPEDSRDMISHLVLVKDDRNRIGVTGLSSQWRHWIELFGWRIKGSTLSVFFPQERVQAEVKVRTWKCAGEAPEPFELCLQISNEQGESAVLYSRKDWVVNAESLDSDLQELSESEPGLAGISGALGGTSIPLDVDTMEANAAEWDDANTSFNPFKLK